MGVRKLRISGLHIPDMKKIGQKKRAKPKRNKVVKTVGTSPATSSQTENQCAPDLLTLIREAHKNIAVSLEELARLAESNAHAASVLVDITTALVDLASDGAGKVQRIWLQGNADALTMWELYGDPVTPRECFLREHAQFILREVASKRLVWPVLLTKRPKDAESARKWLDEELKLGEAAIISSSRQDPEVHGEVFREIAVKLVVDAMSLQEKALRKASPRRNVLENQLMELPSKPDRSWVKLLCGDVAAAFLPLRWPVEMPKLENWRRSWDGKIIPNHQSTKRRTSKLTKLTNSEYRATCFMAHGRFLLVHALNSRLPAGKSG